MPPLQQVAGDSRRQRNHSAGSSPLPRQPASRGDSLDLAKYRNLFVHRDDVFAEQQSSGAYFPVREPITDDDLAEHLAGLASYGVYVIRPSDQTVKYVVFDLDTHDPDDLHNLCCAVVAMLPVEDYRCLLLESSGSKGFHVWLFLSDPVPARRVRAWLVEQFFPVWGGTPIEVFPKQDAVEPGGYGNLVKLPLGVHAVSGKKSEFVPTQGWASGVEDVVPLDSRLVPAAGEPGGATVPAMRTAQGHQSDGPSSPFPCVDRILRDGVGEGYRDRAMFHLALYMYGHGIDQDLAEEACIRANEHFVPPLTEREVRQKVASAYRGRFASARCGSDWLVDVCPGPCRDGWSVRQAQGGALKRADPGDTIEVEVVRVTTSDRKRVTVSHPDADNQPTLVVKR